MIVKTFMDANAAAQCEAGIALADAELARHFGLENEDLEFAVDSMGGYYDDIDHPMSIRRKQVYHPHLLVMMMLTMMFPI
jgi:hypothetical protein